MSRQTSATSETSETIMDGGCRKKPRLSVGGSLNFGLNANAFGRCVVRCLSFNGDNNASAMIGDGLTDAFYSNLLALEADVAQRMRGRKERRRGIYVRNIS